MQTSQRKVFRILWYFNTYLSNYGSIVNDEEEKDRGIEMGLWTSPIMASTISTPINDPWNHTQIVGEPIPSKFSFLELS